MKNTTCNVRVYKTEKRKNKDGKVTSYRVLWQTDGKLWKKPFSNAAQADTYRSALLTAARNGEAFCLATGEPRSWSRTERPSMTWYAFACKFVDMKWKDASAKHRASIAYALTLATFAMLNGAACPYDPKEVRTALRRWGYNSKEREKSPERIADVLGWVARNSEPVSALATPAAARALLDAATSRLDGKRAAATTTRNHRVILSSALSYAVEMRLLDANPITGLKLNAPMTSSEVDRRSVVNPSQARELLRSVWMQKPSGPLLMPFFAALYFAGLRPEEAVELRKSDLLLPPNLDAWGWIHVRRAAPEAGKEWTDSGQHRDVRRLKHRPEGETRMVPCVPELAAILRAHLVNFDAGPDGRLFYGIEGGVLSTSTIRRIWDNARKRALTEEEYASPLAKRPYDLRHACLSTWLNSGVSAKQVAEWAGNGPKVLLSTYSKCLVGEAEVSLLRIIDALGGKSWEREKEAPSSEGQTQPDIHN
ncbi:integrase [Nonomuraea muscovyensis]|uniref:tyrosine-type recombinase/integrase n=1 Tax=Nonomuraea muscovyensis TaxID=1124761 RepID=UPI0033FECAB9